MARRSRALVWRALPTVEESKLYVVDHLQSPREAWAPICHTQSCVQELTREVAINPTVRLVYWRLGDAYVRIEKYEEAEKALKEASLLNETSSGAYILLGQVALKRDDPATATGILERAIKLDPQNDYVHYFLAKAYQGLGRTAEASQQFAIAKQLRNSRRADERAAFQQGP